MSEDFPVKEQIVVLENDEALGPFSVDEILAHIDAGRFDYSAVCLREGALETERLRDLLDWGDEENRSAASDEDSDLELEVEENMDAVEEDSSSDDTVLAPSEILYRGNRSILTFPWCMIGLVGGLVGAFWTSAIDLRLMAGFAIAFIASLAYLTLMRYTCEYFVTPKRVELEKGLIAKSSNEVRIADIRAINVTCDGLSGIMGIGSVDFFTTGDDPEVTFRDVWAAKKVKILVRQLQD